MQTNATDEAAHTARIATAPSARADGTASKGRRAGGHQSVAGALYVHVPFCRKRCAYCDFATAAVDAGSPQMGAYLAGVTRLIEQAADAGLLAEVRTAYVGGGTPTFVGACGIASLVGSITRSAPNIEELSVEANPDSLTDDVIASLASMGATRVSVGVQSLDDDELVALGRLHDARTAKHALAAAMAADLAVSADLMCATPLQTDTSFSHTLCELVELGVPHISVYPLVIEEGTPLARSLLEQGTQEPAWNTQDIEARRMGLAAHALHTAGLARYEVASYAMPGATCQHNIAYWAGVPYLGIGTAASSMLSASGYALLRKACAPQLPEMPVGTMRARLTVTSSTREVAQATTFASLRFDVEYLSEHQALAEDLMLGARLTKGTPQGLLAHAHALMGADLDAALERIVDRGLATVSDGRLIPTERGWLCGNELYGELWGLASGTVCETSC